MVQNHIYYLNKTMSNNTPFLLLACLCVMLVSGCAGKSDKDGVNPKAQYYLYADIEGVGPFRFETNDSDKNFTYGTSGQFNMFIYLENYTNGMTLFGAMPFQGKAVEMEIASAEYQKSRFEKFTSGLNSKHKKSPNGKISITNATDFTLEGTFAFDVYTDDENGSEKISVRNGKFRIRY